MANCSCLCCHLISEVICHCFQKFLLITYPSLVPCGREPCKGVVSSLVYFCCCCNKIFEGRSIILKKKNRFNFAHSPGSSNRVALAPFQKVVSQITQSPATCQRCYTGDHTSSMTPLGTQSSHFSTVAIIERLNPSGAACGAGYRPPNPCIRGSDQHNSARMIQGVLLLWLALRLIDTPRPCVTCSSQGTRYPVQTASSSIGKFYLCAAVTAEHRRRLIISRGTDGKPWLQEAPSGNQLIYLPGKLDACQCPR